MADRTGADRQRRYRARLASHKAGDHSKCDPARCDPTSVTVTGPVTPVTPHVETPGERLWREMNGDSRTGGDRVLVVEAARIADRLDKLNCLLAGGARDWLGIVEDKGNPERQIIVIDRPLAEARQQATALKQIVAELRQASSAGLPPVRSVPKSTKGDTGDVPAGVSSLTARIAAKRGGQATG